MSIVSLVLYATRFGMKGEGIASKDCTFSCITWSLGTIARARNRALRRRYAYLRSSFGTPGADPVFYLFPCLTRNWGIVTISMPATFTSVTFDKRPLKKTWYFLNIALIIATMSIVTSRACRGRGHRSCVVKASMFLFRLVNPSRSYLNWENIQEYVSGLFSSVWSSFCTSAASEWTHKHFDEGFR